MNDTIFAVASPPGRGAVAVLRLSGPGVRHVLLAMGGAVPTERRAALRRLRDPATGETLDRGLVIWFPAPASYTGEDVAELQLHGGKAVVDAVATALIACGVRPAEPGEFTRRAFENQRLDLSEAEAVADLIEAQSAGQRRQALAQLGGRLQTVAEAWRDQLIGVLGDLEAAVDFPDEDLPAALASRCIDPLVRVMDAVVRAAGDVRGERVRNGLRVALIGPPNAGKSSLFNALLGRNAAIVSAVAGTTRDVVEAALVLSGQIIILADTAGLRDAASDEIEREGIRRARDWAEAADIRLHLVAPGEAAPEVTESDWVVLTKADLGGRSVMEDPRTRPVSAKTGQGVEELRRRLGAAAAGLGAGEPPIATRERHRQLLGRAGEHLARALEGLRSGLSPELPCEDVRLAARALASLSGRIDAEDVLGRVFSSFCIGK